eukprot:Anaeramoba_ignava/c21393_g4_i2.p1 GENE.c21393_g4_i2~~c21393_g4_i2.p1  ORF type:complete len:118 (+),score=37.43 c21393_g4_i2:28-354(+)
MDVKVIWESESGILYDGDQIKIVCMSSLTETGITLVKSVSCDLLMAQRIETKTKMKKMTEVANRLHVSFPKQRDNKVYKKNSFEFIILNLKILKQFFLFILATSTSNS